MDGHCFGWVEQLSDESRQNQGRSKAALLFGSSCLFYVLFVLMSGSHLLFVM